MFDVLGDHSWIWVMGVFFPTFLLLMGESNMYQKFYSAKNEKSAKNAVVYWVIGTVVIETAIATLAILAFNYFNGLDATSTYFLAESESEKIILHTARYASEIGLPLIAGLLLIGAAVAIITSTGNSFLLTPSTNLTRDIYQRFINPEATERKLVAFQRLMVLVLGVVAWLLLTQFSTILAMAFTAYTMIGAGLTPALLAAFLWKRVTTAGGVASIATGMGVTLFITIANSIRETPLVAPEYIVLPAAGISVLVLIVVSLATPADPPEKWAKFYQKEGDLSDAIKEYQDQDED
jgi:SSS family solute:Na+ symporter/sodium/proline symporter